MSLNTNKIKERLQKLQSKGGSSERIDYKKLFFKPQLGKQTIRIVPNKLSKDFPFTEVIFHNQNVFKKSIYSLENWSEKDPVVQLRKELYTDTDAETKETSYETAKKLSSRTKAFAQVIVRGRESEGVLLWEMNKTTYEAVLNILSQDDEYGDITDIMEGTDLVVEGYTDTIQIGKRKVDYVAVNITPKRKTSPLSEEESVIEKWLTEQKNPLEIYKKYSYDEIKQLLHEWINPEETSDTEETPKEETDEEPETPVKKAAVKKVIEKPVDEDEDDVDVDEDDGTQLKTQTNEVVKGKAKTKSNKEKFAEMFDDEDE